MEIKPKSNDATASRSMKIGMMACCAIMVLPIAVLFIAGGGTSGFGNGIALVSLLALCVGAHIFMHKKMGKSYHGEEHEKELQPILVKVEQHSNHRNVR